MLKYLLCFLSLIFLSKSHGQIIWDEISNSNFKNLTHLHFADDRVGIACQGDSLLLTKDEGASWSVKTIPGVEIGHCEVFYHNGDTLYVAAGVGHNEVYYGHGFNAAPIKLEQPTLKPRFNSYLSDVVQFGSTIMVLGGFEDSASGKPVIYKSDDFGFTWSAEIYFSEVAFFTKIVKRGNDTLAVTRAYMGGGPSIIDYWRDEMKAKLNQYPGVMMDKASCRTGECFFFENQFSPRLAYHRGSDFFTGRVSITEPDIHTLNDVAFYDRHEVLLIKRNQSQNYYSAVAYHLTPTGYDERAVYVMPDSLKPLRNIALGHNYIYINGKDVIYKSARDKIGLPNDPKLGNHILEFFINRSEGVIRIEGLETGARCKYSLINSSGQVEMEGKLREYDIEIPIAGLKNGLHILHITSLNGNTYQTFKFVL